MYRIRGAYVIVDREGAEGRALVERLAGAEHPPCAVQLRLKRSTTAAMVDTARAIADVVRAIGALWVINDRLDVALAVGADAVHLGQTDLPLAEARRLVARSGRSLIIGVSTHDLAQVEAAVAGGADYLGFGPVFPTRSKQAPDPVVGVDGLRRAVAVAGATPVVAIGGVTPEVAATIAATGAAAACAISAINDAPDPGVAVTALGAPWRSAIARG